MEQKRQSSNKNTEGKEKIITNNRLDNDVKEENVSSHSDDDDYMEKVKSQETNTDFAFGMNINV